MPSISSSSRGLYWNGWAATAACSIRQRLIEHRVHVPRDQEREVVRLLYVATRNQAKALIATLEIDGLE